MSTPMKIGLMYAVAGLTGFAVAGFILSHFMNHSISASTGAGVMAAMIILASRSAYDAGQKANTTVSPV